MTDDVVPEAFSREMGYTRREFLANFDAAFRHSDYRLVEGHTIEMPMDEGRVFVRLGEDRCRRIASLAMPCLTVDFRFENLDSQQRRGFYAAFQRSFHKGGG